MRRFVFIQILSILIILLGSCGQSTNGENTAGALDSSDWPCWRGPDHNGISTDMDWQPQALDGEPHILWEAKIGRGFSSIAVQGENLYCTGNKASQDTVYCLQVADAQVVWTFSYPCRAGNYPGPRSTPAVDKEFVYTMSRDGRVFCLNKHNGEEIWLTDVFIEFGAQFPFWGFASSPIIKEDYLILNVGKYGIVLHKQTGQVVWSSPSAKCGYASPVIFQYKGVDHGLFFGETALYGVELASSTLKWQFEWVTDEFENIADPLYINNKVFISTNSGKGCALLELTESEPTLLWSNNNMESQMSSFIHLDGYIYGNSGNNAVPHEGAFKCMDIKSGSVTWSAELGMGSLILIGDTFVFLTYDGRIFAVQADPQEYNLLAEGKLPRGTYHTPPVYCRNRIYIRNVEGTLYCIDVSK